MDKHIHIRVSADDLERMKRAAREQNLTFSEWIRVSLMLRATAHKTTKKGTK